MTITAQNNQIQKQSNVGIEKTFLNLLKIVGPIAGFVAAISPLVYIGLYHHPQKLPIGATLNANNQTVKLEVARKPHEIAKGLKFRSELAANQGMLFVIPGKAQPIQIWTKDVRFPLDMVFVRNNNVVKIIENVPPCKQQCPFYDSIQEVDKVIELPAHTAVGKLKLKSGSTININFASAPSAQ